MTTIIDVLELMFYNNLLQDLPTHELLLQVHHLSYYRQTIPLMCVVSPHHLLGTLNHRVH